MNPDTGHINPPPHMSEAVFRVFEPFLHQALSAWPEETSFGPEVMVNEKTQRRLSPNTFAARFRDSVVSLERFKWATYIDITKFSTIKGQFAIAHATDGKVWFRNRGRKGRPSSLSQEDNLSSVQSDTDVVRQVWTKPSWGEIEAVCLLIHNRRLVGPIVLDTEILPPQQDELMSRFDVGVHFDSVNNKTIIS